MDKPERQGSAASVISADHPVLKTNRPSSAGLAVPAVFCPQEVADPFDTVEWERHVATIKGEAGEVLFEQRDCEIPADWSQLATNVVANKYLYGEVNTDEREKGVRQLVHRVCRTIADWGSQDGYFAAAEDGERFYRELVWLCIHQHASFNSPVWFNVGLYHQYGIKGTMCNWHWDPKSQHGDPARKPLRIPAGLGMFHSERRRQHGRHHGVGPQRSDALQVRLGHGHGPLHAPLAARKAFRRRKAVGPVVVHARLRPDRRGGQERRQDPPRRQDAVVEGLASRRDGVHRVQESRGEEGSRAGR